MIAAKKIEALLSRLATPDNAAVVEAVHVLAASTCRQKKNDRRPASIARRDDRHLWVWREGLEHEHLGVDGWTVVFSDHRRPDEPPEVLNAEGAIVVEADGFTWTWSEISEGLSKALRAIPPSKLPKERLCPECSRKFLR